MFYIDGFRDSSALRMTAQHELIEKFSYTYTDSFYSDFLSVAKPEDILKELNELISKVFLAYYETIGDWIKYIKNNEEIVRHVLKSVSNKEYTLTKVKEGEFLVEYPEEIDFDETLESYGYDFSNVFDIIHDHISELNKKVEYNLGEKIFEIKLDCEDEEENFSHDLIMTIECAV